MISPFSSTLPNAVPGLMSSVPPPRSSVPSIWNRPALLIAPRADSESVPVMSNVLPAATLIEPVLVNAPVTSNTPPLLMVKWPVLRSCYRS